MASPLRTEIPISVSSGETWTSLNPDLEIAQAPFEEVSTVKIHGRVHVEGASDCIPWTAEFTEGELTYGGLVLQLPGFGGIKRSSRDERHANTVAGRATVSYDPARISGNVRRNLSDAQQLHTATADEVMMAVRGRLATDRNIPNAKSIDAERWILSPHSMGGYPATELGLMHPGMIESVIYKASAGFGVINLCDIDYIKFTKEVVQYLQSGQIEPSIRNIYRIMHYYSRNPSRTFGEAWTCLSVDMTEKVAQLGDLGIRTAYLGFEEDGLVRPEIVEPFAVSAVHEFALLPGLGHLAPQSHPKDTSDGAFALHERITSST